MTLSNNKTSVPKGKHEDVEYDKLSQGWAFEDDVDTVVDLDFADNNDFIATSKTHQDDNGRLPKLQMLCYAGIRSSEPFMFFVLLPFMNEMLVEYGIATDGASTGYAAGLLEAAVWIANALTIMPWVILADRYGRRPILLGSTLICTFMGLLIGFPRAFGTLLVLRFLAGFWNGQAAIAKTYLSELVTEETQAKAFALQSLAWQVGWSLAGLAGGYLSHPERIWSGYSDRDSANKAVSFVISYPYALGPLVTSIVPLLSIAVGYFIMKETLPRSGFRAQLTMTSEMWSALKVWVTMVSCNVSFMCTMPLFMYAPVEAGGLGLPTSAIGCYYAARAAIIIGVEFPIYPRLHRRFGSDGMLKGQIALYPIIFALFPVVSLSRRWLHMEAGLHVVTLALFAVLTALEALAQTIFISGDLLCTNVAPVQELQSKYNAVVEMTAKIGTLVVTWVASWLFAYSAQSQMLGGYLVWAILFVNACFGVSRCWQHKEGLGWRSATTSGASTPMTVFQD